MLLMLGKRKAMASGEILKAGAETYEARPKSRDT